MSDPNSNYFVSQLVQDLEDNLYDSKERIQRLRRQSDELAAENERLRDGVKQVADDLGENAEYAPNVPRQEAYLEAEQRLTELLNGEPK